MTIIRDRYGSASIRSVGTGDLGVLGMVAGGTMIVLLFFISSALLGGIGMILSALTGDRAPAAVRLIVLSGFAGVLAGCASVALKHLFNQPPALLKSGVSAYFNKSLAAMRFDSAFWLQVAIGAAVGALVGAWFAAAGFTSAPGLAQGVYTIENVMPLASGGLGGDPPPSGILASFWLILVVLFAGPIAGAIGGWLVGIFLVGVAGLTKGTAKAGIERALGQDSAINGGAATGFTVGIVAGIVQAVLTWIGIVRFS